MRKPDSINHALMEALGREVRARRVAIEPNQQVFAEAHGYDRNYWGRIERGLQNVSVSTLAKVAAALGTTMPELLDGLELRTAGSVGKGRGRSPEGPAD